MTALATLPEKTTRYTITRSLLLEAKEYHHTIIGCERTMFASRETLLKNAWQLGRVLIDLKEEIGHGNWQLWLPGNLAQLGNSDAMRMHNAWRCMQFFKANLGNSQNLAALPQQFNTDSVRKFMWGYIPAKERPALDGDESVSSKPHYLSFVNHFVKWDRQLGLGHVPMPPIAQFRREMESPLKRIIEIGGKEWAQSLMQT